MIEVERVEQKEPMSIKDAITQLKYDKSMCLFDPLTGAEYFLNDHNRRSYKALEMAIKSLEADKKIVDVLYEIRNKITMLFIFDRESVVDIIDKHLQEVENETIS